MAPVRRLVVLTLFAAACGGDDLTLPGGVIPSELRVLDGNEQDGAVGEPLTDPIVVRAVDAEERGLQGVRVVFQPGAGGATDPESAVTDEQGRATATWRLGTIAGAQALDARVAGSTSAALAVQFGATAAPGTAHGLAQLSGMDQSAAVGTALPDSLVVVATDQFGNPVAGVAVQWSVSAGSIDPETAETGADGRAGARRILGSTAGLQTATADAPGLEGSPITFNQTALPGTSASLELISGDDQSAEPGAELARPLVVRVVDQSGNGVRGQPVSWILVPGNGSVTPTTSETDQDGLATTRWTLGPGEGEQTLSAVASGVGVVGFTAHAETGGGGDGPDHLVFRVQPSDQEKDERITPPVEVAVVDRSGNTVPVSSVKIRITLSPNSNRLKGHHDEDTQAGVAVFDDLKIDRDGDDYTLTATAPELPQLGSAESNPFDVSE